MEKFGALRKPSASFSFWIWCFLFDINWARDWVWVDQSADGSQERVLYFSIHLIKQIVDEDVLGAICLIAGPIKIMVGKS